MSVSTPETAPLGVAVVIVSWNTRDLLARAVTSALAEGIDVPVRVFVVDNASTDGSADMVAAHYRQCELVRSAENLGFGRANNLAIEQSDEPFVLLLNSDAELQPGALRALVSELQVHPEAGAAGARLAYPDGRAQPSVFAFPSLRRYALELVGVADGLTVFVKPRQGEADWVSGACLLLRRQALRVAGAFDACYHMYSEEMDLCRRLWDHGWTVRYCPGAQVVHHVGRSVRHRRVEQPSLLWESRLIYHERHHPAWQEPVLRWMVRTSYLARAVVWGLRARFERTALRSEWSDRARAAWLLARL